MDEPNIKLNCAIYTRKSSEEGLEQNFNSLDSQWDYGKLYIGSQAAAGWVLYDKKFEDGGYSGGNVERPGLKNLIREIELGHIDVVVVYKLDRLTRSLTDFVKLMEVFEQHNVTFVSVTEHFNTTTPMGRLTLNMMLSFAQFEREMTGERIRDKVKASKRKGMWMGGTPPLGYDVKDRELVINKQEAKIVHFVFGQFLKHGSVVKLVQECEERCYQTKSWTTQQDRKRLGRKIDANVINRMLRNQLYRGVIEFKGEVFEGQHEAIIVPETWERVQAAISQRREFAKVPTTGGNAPYLLRGLIFDADGWCMTPGTGGKTRRKRYRYYVSTRAIKHGYDSTEIRSVSAEQIEPLVISQVKQFLLAPEMVQQVYAQAQKHERKLSLDEVRRHLLEFHALWDELFPLEQNRIMQLIIQRITIQPDRLNITFQPNGIVEIYEQITGNRRAS